MGPAQGPQQQPQRQRQRTPKAGRGKARPGALTAAQLETHPVVWAALVALGRAQLPPGQTTIDAGNEDLQELVDCILSEKESLRAQALALHAARQAEPARRRPAAEAEPEEAVGGEQDEEEQTSDGESNSDAEVFARPAAASGHCQNRRRRQIRLLQRSRSPQGPGPRGRPGKGVFPKPWQPQSRALK